MGIFDLFFGSNDTTSFYKLYNKLKDWKKAGVYPSTYNLPKSLSFPTDFWKRIITVHKSTLADGNERAMSVYWADGELVVSPIDIGDGKSVTSRGNISVKYSPHPTRKGYFRKEVILNSSVYKKLDVYHKKAPKKIEIEYLFNMHTHPQHKNDSGEGYYNFFSFQDIKSFIQSNVVVTGLITDKLWILIRSSKTPNDVNFLADTDVTLEKLDELNIGVYSGEFYKKLERLPAPSTRTTSPTT
jgi:hypothetical protein